MDEEKSTFYICSALIKICQFSKALNHLENLIAKTEKKSDLLPVLIYRKGTLLVDSGDFSGALDQFSRALQTPNLELNHIARGLIFYGMAIANRNLSNFVEAEQCAVEAFYCAPSNPEYCQLKEKLEDFNLYHVSTDSIKCLEARYTFKTAEREAMELYSKINDADEFDFSPPLGYYGKGLEILLDAEIWVEVRKKILEEYSTDNAYGIPKKQFMQIPEFFRWALSNNVKQRDTVSLGTWGKIVLSKQDPDPIVNSIYQHLSEKFGEKYLIIQDACKFLAPYRNDIFHKLVLKKGEMESIRKIAIQHINNVISLIYGSLNSIPELSETKVPIDIMKTEEASKFFRNDDFKSAIRCYEDAINHDPTNTDALVGKANAYIKTGEAEKAINCLDIALHLDENDFDAHRVKGLWYATFKKDWRKAAGCFQQALKLNPNDDMAMLNLGCAFWELHEPAMGLKCFKKVKEIKPDNPFVDEEYNNCIRALNGLREWLVKIDKRIDASPDDSLLLRDKGLLHYHLGEYNDAFQSFDKTVKFSPDDIQSWFFRGYSLQRLGRKVEADQSFEMVVFLDRNGKQSYE